MIFKKTLSSAKPFYPHLIHSLSLFSQPGFLFGIMNVQVFGFFTYPACDYCEPFPDKLNQNFSMYCKLKKTKPHCKHFIGIYKIILAATIGCFFLDSSAQNEKYKPVVLDSGSVIVFSPDLRLKTGIEGSIEIIAAFKSLSKVKKSVYTIVLNGNDQQQQYSISIKSDLNTIYFSNGVKTAAWAVPFTDTGLHQLVFVTQKDRTHFYCDAKKVTAKQTPDNVVYGPLYNFKNELRIGDEENEDVQCQIATLRLWHKKLTIPQMAKTLLNYGSPRKGFASDDSLFTELNGYSFFTTETESFFYTNPDISVTPYAGVAHGDYYVYLNTGSSEHTADEIVSLMITNKTNGVGPLIPILAKTKAGSLNDTSLAYTQAISKNIFATNTFNTTNYPVVSGHFSDFINNPSLPPTIRIDSALIKQRKIRRMFGTYNGDHILALRFVTSSNDTIIVSAGKSGGLQQSFCVDIPRYSDFRGFILRQDSLLNSIALLYSSDIYAVDDFTMLNRINASGQWLATGQKPPQRIEVFDTSNFSNVHGNYSTATVYTVMDMIQDSVYIVYADNGADTANSFFIMTRNKFSTFKKKANISSSDSAVLKNFTCKDWTYISGNATVAANQTDLTIYPDSVALTLLPLQLARPIAKQSVFDGKIAWGGTFSQDQRPALSKANFVGYNILTMDPTNFQKDIYSSKEIFAYPKEGSYDYYTTDNRVIVPNGLLYRNDNVGIEKMRSFTTNSTLEYSKGWGINVGANVGVPEVFSFSENVRYQQEQTNAFDSGYSKSVARTVVGKYALVLDKSTMLLSEGFRNAVNKLRNDFVNGIYPDYPGFIKEYGTHYAYAVTYGGMAYLEVTSKQTNRDSSKANALAIEAKAEAVLEGLALGGTAGYSQQFSSAGSQATNVEHVKFGTFGGSMSTGQSWSLQQGEEVPILMDLRPIWDLFSPTFFDDPVIWSAMRNQLHDVILSKGIIKQNPITCPVIDTTLLTVTLAHPWIMTSGYHLAYLNNNNDTIDFEIRKDTLIILPKGVRSIFTYVNKYGDHFPNNPFNPLGCWDPEMKIAIYLDGSNGRIYNSTITK